MKVQEGTKFGYRADIDGLRAIAVALVIFYHFQIEGFSGGFIGVDVFFVISGFLITSLIIKEFINGTFSLPHFFSRRVRRILPALVVVVIFTGVGGFYLLPPNEFSSLAKASKGLAFFISNYIFLRSQNDYWLQNSLTSQPLLHTWSVAIEEQFYILFPLIMTVFFCFKEKTKRSLQVLFWFLSFLALVSFTVSAYLVKVNPPTAFYVLPARGWELLAGALLSIGLSLRTFKIPSAVLNFSSALGLGLIIFCGLFFNSRTTFPAWNALLPCLGALMIIFSGSHQEIPKVNGLLKSKPLVFIGLISYSLYLWHWPFFVLSRSPYWTYWNVEVPGRFFQVTVVFFLSFLSWKFVETPFRIAKNMSVPKTLTIGMALLLSILALGLFEDSIVRGTATVAQDFPKALQNMITPNNEVPFRAWQFSDDPLIIRKEGGKLIGDQKHPPIFLLLGDSFASMWGQALDSRAREAKKSILLMAREWCASLDGLGRKTEPSCYEINQARLKFTEQSKVKNVVLAIEWGEVFTSDSGPYYFSMTHPEEKNLRKVTLERTLLRLKAVRKNVFIVLPIPSSAGSPFNYAIQSLRNKDKLAYGMPLDTYLQDHRTQEMMVEFLALQAKYHFKILDPIPLLCKGSRCLAAKDGNPIYHDEYHLSYYGSQYLVKTFDPLFDEPTP